jgi:hypothetical protein
MYFRRRMDDKLQLFKRVGSAEFGSAECGATKLDPWNLTLQDAALL